MPILKTIGLKVLLKLSSNRLDFLLKPALPHSFGGEMMKRLALSVACCLLLSCFVGCSAHSDTVRGQSPAGPSFGGPIQVKEIGGARYSEAPVSSFANFAQMHRTHNHPVSCPSCPQPLGHGMMAPGNAGNYLWNNAAAQNKVWRPTHFHTYEIDKPKNLVYPPANQPPAIVQYPYYTVKSPTDFFYK